MTDVSAREEAPVHGGSIGDLGLWPVVLGGILALLAPLAGFLGGSIAGSTSTGENMNSVALWLTVGLAVGTIGAFIACIGALRWFKVHRR